MPVAVVGRWGRSLAIRFPADVSKLARLREGDRVEIVVADDEVVIRKPSREEATLDELFKEHSPEAWRALYRDAFDWGPDEGRERVLE